jgi:hypothetical protein
MKIKRIITLTALAVVFTNSIFSQVGIGTTTPAASAELDVTSTTKGFLPPRMTHAQKTAIASPASGLLVWCTDCCTAGELQVFNGTAWTNMIGGSVCTTSISSITCGSSTSNGTLTSGTAASGVSSNVPYTGGNGGTHSGQTVTSTGVTGLTATLSAGTFAVGSGSLTYTITGTPSTSGTATFALSIGGQTCNLNRTINVACGTPVTFTYNGASVTYGIVSSTGSKCWLDRNLGATQVATGSTDANSYGDLFQWGRGADGHQIITSSSQSTTSSTDVPGHANFIVGYYEWRNPQNVDLWQGVNGVNNPCPSGYRLPTNAELDAELVSWGTNTNATGAFASPLKLPLAGIRDNADGSLDDVGGAGVYWSSTVSGTGSTRLLFDSGVNAFMNEAASRASGGSVRCLKD